MATRRAISNEDRQRAIKAYSTGRSIADISNILGIKRQSVWSIIRTYNQTGRTEAARRGGLMRAKLAQEHRDAILTWVNADCSMTLRQIVARLHDTYQVTVGKSTIDRVLSDFHYSWKRTSIQPIARNDEESLELRKRYADLYMTLLGTHSERQFVFVDEMGINLSLRSRYGRSPIGSRAVHVVASLRSRNISVCAAMTTEGIIHFKWQDRAFKSSTFIGAMHEICDRVEQNSQRSIVFVLDNASIHNNPLLREGLNQRGHLLLHLPPYSPFLNPIENLFSKWKDAVRSCRSANEEALIDSLQSASRSITQSDCEGYYRNMFRVLSLCQRGQQIIED